MKLYEIIQQLRNAKGSIEKQNILIANKDDALFKAYMKAVYDVGINYHVTKLPKDVSPGNMATLDQEYLDWLSEAVKERKFAGNEGKSLLKVTLATFDAEGGELFKYIIDRSIGASVGDTMVLKTWPDLYFIPPYQRCSLLDKKSREKFPPKKSFYVQTKLDGSFGYIVKWPDGRAEVITRQGSKYPHAFAEKMALGLKPGTVIVGELEVYKGYHDERQLLDRKTGNGILNSALKDGVLADDLQVQCTAWDLLTTEEFTRGKSDREYSERLHHLKSYELPMLCHGQIVLVQTWVVDSLEAAFTIYRDHTSRGLEGCIIKLPSSLWKDGTAKDIVKLKLKFQVEMRCVDIYEGEGKAKGMLGGIVIQSEDKLLKCNCGSGFTDEQRKLYWADPSLIIEQVVTVEANDITQDRDVRKLPSLSLPIFVEVRNDKNSVADTYARIVYQHEAAKQGG